MLAATVNKIMENVTQVKLEQDNGNLAILDACTLSPCPVTMKCRPTGLQCSATCTDNPDYCLNGGKCWTNAQNLVMCDCNNEHHVYAYSGDRCDLTRIALTGKQLIVISVGGVWFAMMLGVLAICVIAHRCKRHAKREKGAEANYLMHVLQGRSAESPAGMTSEDLGYTSQGEGETSLPDSDVQAGIDSAGSQEEPAPHLAEGTLGVGEGPDGFAGPYERSTGPRGSCAGPRDSSVCPQDSLIGPHDISAGRQDGYTLKEHSHSGSRTSCSSCTSCSSSPCCASQSLNSHSSCSCSCDSGTEVVKFPGTSNSTKMHREGASASVARPLLITVQADVERIPFAPSDVAHSYDGEIPDPLIDSEMPEDEQIHFVNSHPQASPKDPQETTPLLSHCWDGYTCTPNPAFEFDQSFDTTSIIETRPELIKSASERASFSSGRTHSYDGTIPDPVLDFDERQSNDEKLSNETMPTSDKTPMESAINSERSTCQVLCSLPSTNEGTSDVVMTEEHFV
ncbi:uncharacterized protein LOC110975189 [Acanthaster planci]|uniref:Uncharacterized protein LOC110975189 n=1 Tax=Acanthaster planci TaxID=133434 RepID=A0A8B7XQK8_ACAPL|nr:uncharacterized protein LOC110975189 [Acanthaster planci]